MVSQITVLRNGKFWQWCSDWRFTEHLQKCVKSVKKTCTENWVGVEDSYEGSFVCGDVWLVGAQVIDLVLHIEELDTTDRSKVNDNLPNAGQCHLAPASLSSNVLRAIEAENFGHDPMRCVTVNVIDYTGLYILPGLIDSHIHVEFTAMNKAGVDLSKVNGLDSLFSTVYSWFINNFSSTSNHISNSNDSCRHKGIPLIEAFSLDESNITSSPLEQPTSGERIINRFILDKAPFDYPLLIWSRCWHKVWTNTAALKALGIDCYLTSDLNIQSPFTQLNYEGIFRESEIDTFILPNLITGERTARVHKELLRLASLGLTAVQTCDSNASDVYRSLNKDNHSSLSLPIRVFHTPFYEDLENAALIAVESNMDGNRLHSDSCDRSNEAIGMNAKLTTQIGEESTGKSQLNDSVSGSSDSSTKTEYILKRISSVASSSNSCNNGNTKSQNQTIILDDLRKKFNVADRDQMITANTKLSCQRIKIFLDGSIGSRSAAVRNPYLARNVSADNLDENAMNYGILRESHNRLRQKMRLIEACGFGVEVHAIGDWAAEVLLMLLDELNNEHLAILTHCQLLGPDLIPKMHKLGVIANIQPSFVPSDAHVVFDVVDEEKYKGYAYCWKTLMSNKIICAGGSDSPIESADPLKGIFDAIFRPSEALSTVGHYEEFLSSNCTTLVDAQASRIGRIPSFIPKECLTFGQALHLYTIGAALACASHCPSPANSMMLGRIVSGSAADFTVVDRDISSNCLLTIPQAKVTSVWIAGCVVPITGR